ncbi:peptidase S8 [Paenibacillus xerothermodurans]|uniref:Peptidase S8 n=2 Tax=Paenibacillus xerothermodurans TaxID=1977292 RepID=A0A2W1NNV9_PAEXE|nr:peptidase S8 [Paenibacillus xerothermodurans]
MVLFLGTLCAGNAYAKSSEVLTAAAADDPFVEKQSYLAQIHANQAWDVTTGNAGLTIAIVDTGVDLNHPDLQPNLVDGVNLIDPNLPPQDDNGHGTNVAGVVGAVGNNDKGVAGILWQTKIMPIKALESDGSGGEAKLGEGIRYAIDHGAKIVVLSLGLNKYSTYMSDIVRYAEERNVLLVAATGNEGNRVKYPAAYPTVLAVGGMDSNLTADERSNSGSEIDLVAPWDVFTTARGGSYELKDGTSMAAPQVAAVAALAWSRHPDLNVAQLRQLLKQTAQDLSTAGWDRTTGYGLLRADRALTETPRSDMYEPNNRKDQAKSISVSKMNSAAFAGGSDQDWFYLDAPYDGVVHLNFHIPSGQTVTVQHTNVHGTFTNVTAKPGQPTALQVSKGRSHVQLQLSNRSVESEVRYQLTTSFDIYRDQMEDNDRQYKASVLPSRSQTIKGTFHQMNDEDWFELPVQISGSLRIRLSSDTARIDPVLFVQKQGERSYSVDDGGDGAAETMQLSEVFPGSYYIRVSNVKQYALPVEGEYTLVIDYDAKQIDPNEPNNRSYQATAISLNSPYSGLFDKQSDTDWFQFEVPQESVVQLSLSEIPANIAMQMSLYDSSMRPVTNASGGKQVELNERLPAGTHYVKLTAAQPFDRHLYQFTVSAKPLTAGYSDVQGHWAESSIMLMSRQRIIDGYADYTFRPDQTITRAEATVILSRAFQLKQQKNVDYTDLPADHWAFAHIARASQSGIVGGYPDQSFAPDQPVSRMEMITMFARSMNKPGQVRGDPPFTDVDNDYWGVSVLRQMKAEGWIGGYADGTFRPDRQASRAEFVTMLARMKM